jgi:hypothetical protein
MRAQAMPGEDPETISHPSEIAQSILYLTSQKLEENGQIYDRLKASFRS